MTTLQDRPSPRQTADVARDLLNRKLEQSCPRCGRWEAAHRYCSWCLRPMGPADWYFNGDTRERHGRRPSARPANPPSEYAESAKAWPPEWGPFPYQRGPRKPQPPITPGIDPVAVYSAAGGTLGLL